MPTYPWPYKNELNISETRTCDVLVLGGGLAGCYAAIAAARRGQSVIPVEKGTAPEKGRPPLALYPGEYYYCSACAMACPVDGAVRLQHPLMNRAKFASVRKGDKCES